MIDNKTQINYYYYYLYIKRIIAKIESLFKKKCFVLFINLSCHIVNQKKLHKVFFFEKKFKKAKVY